MNYLNNTKKSPNSIQILIVCILIFNTISILAMYFVMDRRLDRLSVFVMQNMTASENGVSADPVNISTPDYQLLGSDSASVNMVLITDLECPYCQKLYSILFPPLYDDFIGRGLLRLNYAPFPLESRHPKAMPAAAALHCADSAGELWRMFNYLSSRINDLDIDQILKPDVDFIVDKESFGVCVESDETSSAIREIREEFADAGIKGTPALIINDKQLSGFSDFDDISSYIDAELRDASYNVVLSEVKTSLDSDEIGILDVRTSDEFSAGYLPGAVNIDYLNSDSFKSRIAELPKNARWIIYCKSGLRSTRAWHVMKAEGFTDIHNMTDGFDGWSTAENVIVK